MSAGSIASAQVVLAERSAMLASSAVASSPAFVVAAARSWESSAAWYSVSASSDGQTASRYLSLPPPDASLAQPLTVRASTVTAVNAILLNVVPPGLQQDRVTA